MLTAAQEQAERAISSARADADKTRTTARAEADHVTAEARKKADNALSTAKSQAKQTLDEATARAAAIHDGAERRLNLLSTRHAETIRRLTDILDGVSGLVAAETSRPSLEDEVDQSVAKTMGQKQAEPANARLGTGAAGSPSPAATPGRPGNGTPLGGGAAAAARPQQRPAPGIPGAPVPPSAPRPDGSPRTSPGTPVGQTSSAQPGTPGQPAQNPVLVHPRGGAHEAPRGGAHEAPRGRQETGSVPPSAPLPADQLRQSASGPASDSEERPGRPSPAHRAGESNYSGAIDKDETTEGVRIVRDQRQR
jgi:hypothetical protein